MTAMSDELIFREITVDLERLTAQMHIAPEMLTLSVDHDDLFGHVVARLVRVIATIPAVETVTVPETWWDALKAAEVTRSPIMRWWVRRRPVRETVYRARVYFPDATLPTGPGFDRRVYSFVPGWSEGEAAS